MLKYGLENEFFLLNKDGLPVMPATVSNAFPIDSCGYLVEARGLPNKDIYQAIASLQGETKRLEDLAIAMGYTLSKEPVMTLSKQFLHDVSKKYSKGITHYRNYMGYINNRIKANERTAGMHISVTDECVAHKNNTEFTYNKNLDWLSIFLTLDTEFADEIKAAKRNQGFYELKDDGRIEYRSLPNNVDTQKLIKIINTIK